MRKINVHGHSFHIASKEDMRNAPPGSVYILIRVADADPRLGSAALKARRTKINCVGCDELCWFDPAAFDGLPAHVPKLCAHCVMIKAEAERARGVNLRPAYDLTNRNNVPRWIHRPSPN